MGNNYNIKRNVPEPAREDIEKFMDFDALLKAYQNTETPQEGAVIRNFNSPREGQFSGRMRRWIIMGGGLAAAAAVALLIIVRSLSDLPTPAQSQAVADAYFAQQPYVNPPLANVESKVRPVTINASEGATLDVEEGTRLIIPRMAFQSDRGQLIESGEVDIYYREMHDAVDFFMAGVPMTYDSAGTRHYLQSAGMIEVYAMQDGRRVSMAPGKNIRIELQSELAAQPDGSWPSFKVYHLDAESRNWTFEGSSTLLFEEENDASNGVNSNPTNQLEIGKVAILAADPQPEAPTKPVKSDSKVVSFELDLKNGEIPIEPGSEAAVADLKSGGVWQVLPNCPAFNTNELNLEWKSVRLKRIGDNSYDMTLLKDDKQLKLLVQPLMTNRDYELALKKYEEEQAQYESKLKQWEQRTQEKIAVLESRLNKSSEEDEGNNSEIRKVRHIFDIDAFGIWNCDRPAPLARSSFRIRTIEDQNGQKYDNQTAYLSDENGQSIYQLHTGRGSTVYFDKNKEYLLWMLTPEGKIALVKTQAEWAESNPRKGVKLKVKTLGSVIRNEADIRRALNPN